jgi:nitrite reductase/ring-hydroxylating ferredoxin subunit
MGNSREFEANGVRILLVRRDDEFFAFPPLCPHQEEELEISGVCDGEILTCSKHLWQWNIRTGQELGEAERPLLKYKTRARMAKCRSLSSASSVTATTNEAAMMMVDTHQRR